MSGPEPTTAGRWWITVYRFDGPRSGDAPKPARAATYRAIQRIIKRRELLRTVEAAALLAQARKVRD